MLVLILARKKNTIVKFAGDIIKEGNKSAACYESAFGHLTDNPLGGLKKLWKCIKGGK
jgi:hypothetical protein